eukprot:GHVQ01007530.1.p1 GENE.GHVQ01007530.1~~GHVQ01007530.1.p1  ORF type:complete len:1029 (+),score=257.04 GHVQ01007530.1:994-4080(+)
MIIYPSQTHHTPPLVYHHPSLYALLLFVYSLFPAHSPPPLAHNPLLTGSLSTSSCCSCILLLAVADRACHVQSALCTVAGSSSACLLHRTPSFSPESSRRRRLNKFRHELSHRRHKRHFKGHVSKHQPTNIIKDNKGASVGETYNYPQKQRLKESHKNNKTIIKYCPTDICCSTHVKPMSVCTVVPFPSPSCQEHLRMTAAGEIIHSSLNPLLPCSSALHSSNASSTASSLPHISACPRSPPSRRTSPNSHLLPTYPPPHPASFINKHIYLLVSTNIDDPTLDSSLLLSLPSNTSLLTLQRFLHANFPGNPPVPLQRLCVGLRVLSTQDKLTPLSHLLTPPASCVTQSASSLPVAPPPEDVRGAGVAGRVASGGRDSGGMVGGVGGGWAQGGAGGDEGKRPGGQVVREEEEGGVSNEIVVGPVVPVGEKVIGVALDMVTPPLLPLQCRGGRDGGSGGGTVCVSAALQEKGSTGCGSSGGVGGSVVGATGSGCPSVTTSSRDYMSSFMETVQASSTNLTPNLLSPPNSPNLSSQCTPLSSAAAAATAVGCGGPADDPLVRVLLGTSPSAQSQRLKSLGYHMAILTRLGAILHHTTPSSARTPPVLPHSAPPSEPLMDRGESRGDRDTGVASDMKEKVAYAETEALQAEAEVWERQLVYRLGECFPRLVQKPSSVVHDEARSSAGRGVSGEGGGHGGGQAHGTIAKGSAVSVSSGNMVNQERLPSEFDSLKEFENVGYTESIIPPHNRLAGWGEGAVSVEGEVVLDTLPPIHTFVDFFQLLPTKLPPPTSVSPAPHFSSSAPPTDHQPACTPPLPSTTRPPIHVQNMFEFNPLTTRELVLRRGFIGGECVSPFSSSGIHSTGSGAAVVAPVQTEPNPHRTVGEAGVMPGGVSAGGEVTAGCGGRGVRSSVSGRELEERVRRFVEVNIDVGSLGGACKLAGVCGVLCVFSVREDDTWRRRVLLGLGVGGVVCQVRGVRCLWKVVKQIVPSSKIWTVLGSLLPAPQQQMLTLNEESYVKALEQQRRDVMDLS